MTSAHVKLVLAPLNAVFSQQYVEPTQSGYVAIMLVTIMPMYKIRPSDECAMGTKFCNSTKSRLALQLSQLLFWGTGHGKKNYTPHLALLPNPTLKCVYDEVLPLLYGDVMWCYMAQLTLTGRLYEGKWARRTTNLITWAQNFFWMVVQREATEAWEVMRRTTHAFAGYHDERSHVRRNTGGF